MTETNPIAELFSPEWMQAFGEKWNADTTLAAALGKIQFSSVIGYGFQDEANPKGVLIVQAGQVVAAGAYQGQPLNWDLRADRTHWQQWLAHGLTLMGLGIAYMTRKLEFRVGDYAAMIQDPRMAAPFIQSFAVMGRV